MPTQTGVAGFTVRRFLHFKVSAAIKKYQAPKETT
jgi:hypothetical protein